MMKDLTGRDLSVGDEVIHINFGSRRATRREILSINVDKQTCTISPEDVTWRSGRPGTNVKGCNLARIG